MHQRINLWLQKYKKFPEHIKYSVPFRPRSPVASVEYIRVATLGGNEIALKGRSAERRAGPRAFATFLGCPLCAPPRETCTVNYGIMTAEYSNMYFDGNFDECVMRTQGPCACDVFACSLQVE